ncbi:MAG: hypothetical protein AAB400_00190, partial [Patescibacteria group bacterium]
MTMQTLVNYWMHQRTDRMVITNGSQSKTAFALGSFEMFREIGLIASAPLFKEVELGVMLALLLPKNTGYDRVQFASTTMGSDIDHKIIDVLSAVHQFNTAYYAQANVFGGDYEHIPMLPPIHDPDKDLINQPTGVSAEFLARQLANGAHIHLDRNDSRIGTITANPLLAETTEQLNDKNFMYRLMDEHDVSFKRPLAVLIDDIPLDALDILLTFDDAVILGEFSVLMEIRAIKHEGTFKPFINYFVKVAGGAGGNSAEASICRVHPIAENGAHFRKMLENIKRRKETGVKSCGLQLQEPIAA